jgi:hypothetical protein
VLVFQTATKLVGTDFVGDQIQYFIIFWETVSVELGKDGFVVHDDFETTTITWLEGDIGEVLVVLVDE